MTQGGLRASDARRTLLCISVVSLIHPVVTFAQASRRVARVGWLGWSGDTTPVLSMPLAGLRSGLHELGWAEGDNLDLNVRVGDYAHAAALAAEMIRARVEVIVAQGPMIFTARTQSGSTPVVFAINGDPVEAGLVASLAHPGGNLTGITALSSELAAKRLEFLNQVQPRVTTIAVLANDRHPGVRRRDPRWKRT